MFVNESMTRDLATIEKSTLILDARELMVRREIRHLPVVDTNNRLLGMVTDRDIRSALPRDYLKRQVTGEEREIFASLTAEDIMATNLIVVKPTYTIQDALVLFQQNVVGAMPVVDDEGIVKGILSVRDLMRAFINVLGIGEPGTLLGIVVEEKVGQMKKIVDAITEENISCGSILVARYWDKDKRAVFPYLLTQNVSRVKKKLGDLGFTLLDPMKWYLDSFPENE
jgi:acetoin utilization protein AcuB